MSEISDLIDRYWQLAYAEGRDNRQHDTKNDDAQGCRSALDAAVTALLDRIGELTRERNLEVQRADDAEAGLAEARADALEEAKAAVERFIPLCFDGTVGGRSIKDDKQALLRDVARVIRALKGGANG